MSPAKRAVVVGTISLDLVAERPGATTASAAAGNSGANIAIRLAAAGWAVEMVSLIGADRAGDLVREDLERWGVRTTGLIARPGYRTPHVFQTYDPDDPSDSTLASACPHCRRPRGHLLAIPAPHEIGEPVRAWAAASDLIVVDVVGPTSVQLAVASPGVVWYEASLREAAADQISAFADLSHVVKYSADEADTYDEPVFANRGPSAAHLITAGAEGTRYRTRLDAGWSPWTVVPSALASGPLDTIGAGDAFTAATATHLVAEPGDLGAAVAAGNRSAARTCLSVGARGDMVASGTTPRPWVRTAVPFRCGRCDPPRAADAKRSVMW